MATASGDKLFGGSFGGLVAFSIAGIGIHALRPAASYRALELGGNAITVGLVAASFSLVSVFLAIPVGRGVDRFSHRWFFLGGTFLMFVGAAAGALSGLLAILVVCQLLVGFGWVTTAIAFQTATANRRNSNRDRGFARLAIAASASQLIGPLVAGFVLDFGRERSVGLSGASLTFMAAAGFSLVGCLIAVRTLVVDQVGDETTVREQADKHSVKDGRVPIRVTARREGVLQALIVGFVVQAAIDLMVVYLPLVGEERGLKPVTVGALLAVSGAGGLLSRIALPFMLDRLGRPRLLTTAVGFGAAAAFGVAFTSSIWVLVPLLAVFGYALGLGAPLTMAWLSAQVPLGERGVVLAMRMSGVRVALVVFPVALGAVATATGPGAVFLLMAGFLSSSTLFLRKRKSVTTLPR